MKTSIFAFLFALFSLISVPRAFAATAVADIKGTTEGSKVSGQAKFEETPDGIKLSVKVSNVAPGKHGFHIHENGACGNQGNDAGGHFNPDKVPHGFLPVDGVKHAHAGDFGNIDVGTNGSGSLEVTMPLLSLSEGKYNVAGKAVIVHEKEDSFGQPTGNAGGRIGCGIITAK